MPTGSGKSFIAELAVSQAVSDGWALYLAPTNALTEQVRGDLREGLSQLGTEVFAFVGDQEYSILAAERVVEMPATRCCDDTGEVLVGTASVTRGFRDMPTCCVRRVPSSRRLWVHSRTAG